MRFPLTMTRNPARFPLAAILPQNIDVYTPQPEVCSYETLCDYRTLRKQLSRLREQVAVLVAMAQSQAQVLDIRRFRNKDPRLHVFLSPCNCTSILVLVNCAKPFLIVPNFDKTVQIIRALIPRQLLVVLHDENWS